jgi:hypothetical protein
MIRRVLKELDTDWQPPGEQVSSLILEDEGTMFI